jgi:phosphatidylinositol alpha-mannosyltransferase
VSEYARPWVGGIPEVVHHEAQELAGRGHYVRVITGPAHRQWTDDVDTVRLRYAARYTQNGAANRLSMGWQLLALGRQCRDLDVLHIHAPLDPLLGLAACRLRGIGRVGTFHSSFREDWLLDRLYSSGLVRRAWHGLQHKVAVSEEARRSITRLLPGDYHVISNGIDVQRFHPEHERPLSDRFLLFVGRHDPRKGLRVLLQAWPEIAAAHPDLRLVLAGVDASSALPAGAVALGQVSAEALPAWFAAADVVCAPSLHGESQGIVLLEAMASGTPPVAFRIPGYEDVIRSGVDGVLVDEVGDPAALGKELRRLLADTDLRQTLGTAARDRATQHAWPVIVDQLLPLLREAAAGGR